jgi:tryptophan halogenase
VFLDASWVAVYTGQGIIPQGHDPRADLPTSAALLKAMDALRADIRAKVERMPDHRSHIESYCPMPVAA